MGPDRAAGAARGVSSSVSNLTAALQRKLGKLAPHLDPHLHGGADDLWERIELLPGAGDADENPFDGLNAGVVTVSRAAGGGHDVTFELLTHDGAGGARAVFSTPL